MGWGSGSHSHTPVTAKTSTTPANFKICFYFLSLPPTQSQYQVNWQHWLLAIAQSGPRAQFALGNKTPLFLPFIYVVLVPPGSRRDGILFHFVRKITGVEWQHFEHSSVQYLSHFPLKPPTPNLFSSFACAFVTVLGKQDLEGGFFYRFCSNICEPENFTTFTNWLKLHLVHDSHLAARKIIIIFLFFKNNHGSIKQ